MVKKSFLQVFMITMLLSFLVVVPTGGETPIKIGITQIVEHPALDSARQGFQDALAQEGWTNVTFDMQNAQGDMATATTIARKFADDRVDLILAIATPTAQAAAQVTSDIPILITAVTDPVAAGLVNTMESPGTNVTGTTDMTPVKTQLELLLEIAPSVQRVGILFNVGEVNSVVQVELAKQVAGDLGLEIVEAGATTSGEVLEAARSLPGRVDAIYVPTDNTVVSALESVIMVAEDNNLPLIVGEEESVVRGGLATTGINYYDLGFQTGLMAIQVLNGADPQTMPIQSADRVETVLNLEAARNMGIEFPASLLERAHRTIGE